MLSRRALDDRQSSRRLNRNVNSSRLFSSDTLIDFLARFGIRVRFVVTPSRRRTVA
jgi:hypothetical protein